MRTVRAGIALGSNLGDRLANLRAARAALEEVCGGPVLCGGMYRTAPVDCPADSPDFFNTVVEVEWCGTAAELHAATRRIERRMGRAAEAPRNAPRVIDLDLLYVGAAVCDGPDLMLPHPRMARRAFVLRPLADLRPDLVPPGAKISVAAMLDALAEPDGVEAVAREW